MPVRGHKNLNAENDCDHQQRPALPAHRTVNPSPRPKPGTICAGHFISHRPSATPTAARPCSNCRALVAQRAEASHSVPDCLHQIIAVPENVICVRPVGSQESCPIHEIT